MRVTIQTGTRGAPSKGTSVGEPMDGGGDIPVEAEMVNLSFEDVHRAPTGVPLVHLSRVDWFLLTLSLSVVFILWSVPATLIGLLLCATLVFFIPGVATIAFGALPLTAIVAHYVAKSTPSIS